MFALGRTRSVRGVANILASLRAGGTPNVERLHLLNEPHFDTFEHGRGDAGEIELPLEVSFAYAEDLLDRWAAAARSAHGDGLGTQDYFSFHFQWTIFEDGTFTGSA